MFTVRIYAKRIIARNSVAIYQFPAGLKFPHGYRMFSEISSFDRLLRTKTILPTEHTNTGIVKDTDGLA